MSELNLHTVVDRALDASPAPDPHAVARAALMRIPVGSREDALLLALAAYVEARIYERQEDPMPTRTVSTVGELRS